MQINPITTRPFIEPRGAGGGLTRLDFGRSNSSRTLSEPAHDRTPGRLAVSDDGLYLATLSYGTVEVIDLPAGSHKWTFQRYDGAGLDIRGPRVFSVHDDSRSIAAVVHGLDGRLLGELRLYDDPSPFAVSGAGDAVAFLDKKGNLMVRDIAFARGHQKQR